MTSLDYNDIFSCAFNKIEAYDFLEMSENDLNELLCDWIHSASANPYVRRLFKTLQFDDVVQELSIEMKYSIDDDSDKEFIREVMALGIVIEWLEPKIASINTISQVFSNKESKFYSQSNHLSELRNLRNDLTKKQRRLIADRGYAWNTYLDGE